MEGDHMKITEVFSSINGEICAQHQGSLATFIRTWGCNLNCTYCFGMVPGRKIPKLVSSERRKDIKLNEVKVGDVLLTFDDNKNVVETTVEKVFCREVDHWLRIKINGHFY